MKTILFMVIEDQFISWDGKLLACFMVITMVVEDRVLFFEVFQNANFGH